MVGSTGATSGRSAATRAPARVWATRSSPPRSTGRARRSRSRQSAWKRSDAWMAFLARTFPKALTFLYLPDEPYPAQYPEVKRLAENVRSNPGPGRQAAPLPHQADHPGVPGARRHLEHPAAGLRHRRRRGRAGQGPPRVVLQRRTPAGPDARHRRSRDRGPRHRLGGVQARRGPLLLLARRPLAAQRPEAGRAQPERVGEPDHVRQPRPAQEARRGPGLDQRRRRAALSRRGEAPPRGGPRARRADRHGPAREPPPRAPGPRVPDPRPEARPRGRGEGGAREGRAARLLGRGGDGRLRRDRRDVRGGAAGAGRGDRGARRGGRGSEAGDSSCAASWLVSAPGHPTGLGTPRATGTDRGIRNGRPADPSSPDAHGLLGMPRRRSSTPRLFVAERDPFSGLPALRARWAAGERPSDRPAGPRPLVAPLRRRVLRAPGPRGAPGRQADRLEGLEPLRPLPEPLAGLRLALRLPGLRRGPQGRGGGRPRRRRRADAGPPVAQGPGPGLVPQPHRAGAGPRRLLAGRGRGAPLGGERAPRRCARRRGGRSTTSSSRPSS